MDQLSSIDASFLHMETPETPMHVGSLALIDLPDDYDRDFYEDAKSMVAARLHLAAALTRKLAPMPFELSEPVWIDDDDIDIEYHFRSVVLRRPGTMAQLEQQVARLHSTLLDRSRPLWEMYVIEGLETGQVAFYAKTHHSAIDGKAGVELSKVMNDITPEIRQVPPQRRKRKNTGYQLGVAELLQAAAANAAKNYRRLAELAPIASKAFSTAADIITKQRTEPGKRPLNLGLAPKTIFNVSIINQRSYATLSLPMADVKNAGKRAGGTINTVVMTMCSIALGRFLKERDLLPSEPLIAVVPVSLRNADDKSMNNQVSQVRVDLATDTDDLTERFGVIHASSEAGKAIVREIKPILGVDVPVMGSPWLLTGLASLAGRSSLAEQMPAIGNVLISNVPGPPIPLYLAGAKIAHSYPVSIPVHGLALNMTMQSYAGWLEFGLTSCQRAMSQQELQELVGYLKGALEDIEGLPAVEVEVPPVAPAVAPSTKKAEK